MDVINHINKLSQRTMIRFADDNVVIAESEGDIRAVHRAVY